MEVAEAIGEELFVGCGRYYSASVCLKKLSKMVKSFLTKTGSVLILVN